MGSTAAAPIVYRRDNDETWSKFIAAKHSGEVVEIDGDMFRYWLNVLPTKGEHRRIRVGGVSRFVDFLQAEGEEELCAFWIEGTGEGARYFCQQTNIMNPYA